MKGEEWNGREKKGGVEEIIFLIQHSGANGIQMVKGECVLRV